MYVGPKRGMLVKMHVDQFVCVCEEMRAKGECTRKRSVCAERLSALNG